MKLNFNFQFKDLNGKEQLGDSASKWLGSALFQMNNGNSVKLYDWALKLWNNQVLEVDDTDAKVLHELINTTQLLAVGQKVPLMDVIKKEQKKIEDEQERTKKLQEKKK